MSSPQPTPGRRPPWTLVVPAAVASVAALVSALMVLWDGWRAYRGGTAGDVDGWYVVGVLVLPWAACVVLASAWAAVRHSRYAQFPLIGLLLPALVVSLVALSAGVDDILVVTWLVVAVGCLASLLSPPTWRYQSTASVIGSKRENGRR